MTDWTGENSAAWAQAILSAMAIWYSGRLAYNQARSSKREKVQTYIRIIAIASQEAERAMAFVRDAHSRQSPIGGDLYGFGSLQKSLESISFHDVPDHRLISIIRDAASACSTLDVNCDQIMNESIPVSFINLTEVEDAASILIQCFMDSADIDIGLLPWNKRLWVKFREKLSTIFK